MLLMVRVVNSLLALLLLVPMLNMLSASVYAVTLPGLVISEIKVRHDTSDPTDYDEFIELHNLSAEAVSLSGYTLEYFNTTTPTASQVPSSVAVSEYILESGAQLVLAKDPTQVANAIELPFSSLLDTGGRLRLVDPEGTVLDEVAWANTQSKATAADVVPAVVFQCSTTAASCVSKTQSISRVEDGVGTYATSGFLWVMTAPSPISYPLSEPVAEIPEGPDTAGTPGGMPEVPTNEESVQTCEGVVLSELLPNPGGSDAGNEFIELHNPTNEIIQLEGCGLQTSANSKVFTFTGQALVPGAYAAVSSSVSGLTLANGAGGTVWLLSPTDELDTITYPADLDDDVSWGRINSEWLPSYQPSPGEANIDLPLKPCAEGQARDAISGECEDPIIVATAKLLSCKPGQQRNPETNRCRNIATALSSVLVACKAGQERNPETNRCRNIATSSQLQPCDEDEERNKETNRCRKVDSVGSALAAVTDVPAKTKGSGLSWWLVGASLLAALSYALFEWRRDVANLVLGVRQKLTRG